VESLLARRRGGRRTLDREEGESAIDQVREHGRVERLLALEVVVDRGHARARSATDLAHRRGLEAPLGKNLRGSVEDAALGVEVLAGRSRSGVAWRRGSSLHVSPEGKVQGLNTCFNQTFTTDV
jgi:hypothetical protein